MLAIYSRLPLTVLAIRRGRHIYLFEFALALEDSWLFTFPFLVHVTGLNMANT